MGAPSDDPEPLYPTLSFYLLPATGDPIHVGTTDTRSSDGYNFTTGPAFTCYWDASVNDRTDYVFTYTVPAGGGSYQPFVQLIAPPEWQYSGTMASSTRAIWSQ